MNEEILDNDFYKKKEIPARDWWENKRGLFNKFCGVSIACLYLITFILFFKTNNLFKIVSVITIYSLANFTICNLCYSVVWIIEDLTKKFFYLKTNHKTRLMIFKIIILLQFMPTFYFIYLMFWFIQY